MTAPKEKRVPSREKLLSAAEALMRESGYAAVTSRQVARRAGLKPQLVHYYFDSMDDLFVAVYREFANGLMQRQEGIRNADNPLREMWRVATEARGVLLSEFIALANHRKVIQSEITDFGHRFRRSQIEIIADVFERRGISEAPWTPAFTALMLNSLARSLTMEGTFAIDEGHREVLAVVEEFIARFDA